jgi:hypothetical protein
VKKKLHSQLAGELGAFTEIAIAVVFIVALIVAAFNIAMNASNVTKQETVAVQVVKDVGVATPLPALEPNTDGQQLLANAGDILSTRVDLVLAAYIDKLQGLSAGQPCCSINHTIFGDTSVLTDIIRPLGCPIDPAQVAERILAMRPADEMGRHYTFYCVVLDALGTPIGSFGDLGLVIADLIQDPPLTPTPPIPPTPTPTATRPAGCRWGC